MLLRVWGFPLTLEQYRVVEIVLALAAAAFVWTHRQSWPRSLAIAACGAVAACWMTLAGPATESSTLILAGPLLAECVLDSLNRPGWRRSLSLASWMLMTIGAMIVWFPHQIARPVHSTAIQPLGLLLLTIVVVSQYRSAPASDSTVKLQGWPRSHAPWRRAASESSRK
jgi:hypothetical protein